LGSDTQHDGHGSAVADWSRTTTRRLAHFTLDVDRLAEDMARCDRFRFGHAYSEFICGSYKGVALCNATGDLYDNLLVDYEGPYRVTEHGRQMPYVLEMVGENFHTEFMRFARLGRMTPGSLVIPHRDYLELDEEFVRIHIPLHTSDTCFSGEDDTIYQMRQGDVWFIDATRAHSAVSFFEEDRTHLILDFICDTVEGVLRFEPNPIPADDPFDGATVPRGGPLTDEQRSALLGLSAVINEHNYRDVLALIGKQYFVSEMSAESVFDLACEIARIGGQAEALEKLEWLRTHVLFKRLD